MLHTSIAATLCCLFVYRPVLAQYKDCSDLIEYSVYNSSSGLSNKMPIVYDRVGYRMTRILLDTYPGGRISIQVNASRCTTTSEPVKCVKMVLQNSDDKVERYDLVEPYWLYGDSDGVPVTLRPKLAWGMSFYSSFYPTSNCTGTAITESYTMLGMVRRTKQIVHSPRITVTYNGTNTNVATFAETRAVFNATCNFLRGALPGVNVHCWKVAPASNNVTNSTPPLKIAFRVRASLTVSPNPSSQYEIWRWQNQIRVTKDWVTTTIRNFLSERDAIDYAGTKFLTYSIFLKGIPDTSWEPAISLTNPYASYKNLIVE